MAKLKDKHLAEVLERISKAPVMEISTTYHPSECFNQDLNLHSHFDNIPEWLDIINNYHAYCRLCKHHYYYCSVFNDINSFFQIHINSLDHIWNRGSCNWDESKPIFQWEKWLLTGFCAICNKSGIAAFFMTESCFTETIKHSNYLEHKERYRLLNYEPFKAIIGKLALFSKIYIVKLSNGQYFCKVCGFRIEGESVLEHHLSLYKHCTKFCELLEEKFNVTIDVKFDAEELAQQMKELPEFKRNPAAISETYNDWLVGKFSEISELRYFASKRLGFCPLLDEKTLYSAEDRVRKSHCPLCNVWRNNMNRHISSNSHQLRVMVFKRCNLVRRVSLPEYTDFTSFSKKDKRNLSGYMRYKNLLEEKGLDFGIPFKPEYANIELNTKNTWGMTYTSISIELDVFQRFEGKSLQLKNNKTQRKMEREEKMINKSDYSDEKGFVDTKIIAEILSDEELDMLRSRLGKYLKEKASGRLPRTVDFRKYFRWQVKALKQYRHHPDFINLLKKWNYLDISCFVCIICGTTLESEDIFPHIKSAGHIHRFEMYLGGTLRPIHPAEYKGGKKTFYCRDCDKPMWSANSDQKVSAHAVGCIKHHNATFSGDERPSSAPVDYKNVFESRTADLKRIPMTGDESKTADSTGVVSSPPTNHVRESTSETDGKEVENSSPRQTTASFEKTKLVNRDEGNESQRNKGKTQEEEEKTKAKPETEPKKIETNPEKNKVTQGGTLKEVKTFLKRCKDVLTEYLCVICLMDGSIDEIVPHLNSKTHIANGNYMRSKFVTYMRRITPVQFEVCKCCQLFILGTSDMFLQHYASLYHVNKEREASGNKSAHVSPTFKSTQILVVRGLPNVSSKEKDRIIRSLLSPFATILRVYVKPKSVEVQFFDHRYIEVVHTHARALKKVIPTLRFATRTLRQEPEIAMKSSEIFLLGQGEKLLATYIFDLVKQANDMLSEHEKKKEDNLCEALQREIGCIFPNSKCYKFGSRVTGLAFGECDLDVFFDYGDVYYADGTDNSEDQDIIVEKVAAVLRKSMRFSRVLAINRCRVPIVICVDHETNIRCDISFKNGLSCENTKLIKFMISIDDRVKEVILFIKSWAKKNDLHGRPLFSSYALTMLVFFYLQQEPNPVLPTIEFLKSCYEGPEKVIGGWDCGFTTDKGLIPKTENTKSVAELILGFFDFCLNFNFGEVVISPLTGEPLSKVVFERMAEDGLPPPYEKYCSKISINNFGVKESICIMDPFDLNHNLTKFFTRQSFKRFIYLCRLSSTLLSNSLKSKYFYHLYEDPKSEVEMEEI